VLRGVLSIWLFGGFGGYAAVDAPELTAEASAAIDRGLKHLLDAQKEDGSWAATEDGTRSVAITSLALMAFMSKAQFPGSGPNGDKLNRAKDWLLNTAKAAPDGYLGTSMYEHGLATLALTELWGMTRDKDEDDEIQEAIEKAVEVILRSQNAGGGWRYEPSSDNGQDTSVTVMVFIGLASARQAGIVVPNETIAKVVRYFESATSQKTGGFNYVPSGVQKNDSIACTGGGAYAAQLAGERGSEMVLSAIRFLQERSPGIIQGNFGHYYYGHYYAAQAMVQAGDDYYADWYPQIRDALIQKQNDDGSWGGKKNKQGVRSASYETPMAIITLAIPHRYIPIYQR
jgi:squalene cyclase